MGDERAVQDIAYPDLVGPAGLKTPVGTGRRRAQCLAGKAEATEVLPDGALGEPDPVRPADYVDDLG